MLSTCIAENFKFCFFTDLTIAKNALICAQKLLRTCSNSEFFKYERTREYKQKVRQLINHGNNIHQLKKKLLNRKK